jgi:hypothetical protein
MNRTALCALSAALFCVAGSASAQSGQEYQYPSANGSLSPPSTLRMTVTPEPGAVAAPPPVRDSPQSLELYTQCRDEADRAAVSAAKMREAVAGCLNDLAQRRANGQ